MEDGKAAKPRREGGYGWVIVSAVFLSQYIVYGTLSSLGVLLTTVKDDFGEELGLVGSVMSFHYAVQLLLAPLARKLARKVGVRAFLRIGGALYGLGLVVGSRSSGAPFLAVTLLVSGCGAAMISKTLDKLVKKYFNTRLPIINFMVSLGDPAGVMVYGPVTQVLLDRYGWRGTMLLLAAFGCNLVAAGFLVRSRMRVRRRRGYKTIQGTAGSNGTPPTASSPINTGRQDASSQSHEDQSVSPPSPQVQPSSPPVPDNDPLPGDGTPTLAKYLKIFASATNLKIFQDGHFTILGVSKLLATIPYVGIVVYLIPNGLSLGLSPTEASFLSTAWGIGNAVGTTLAVKAVVNKHVPVHAFTVLTLIAVVCCFVTPYISGLFGHLMITVGMGVGVSCIFQVLAELSKAKAASSDSESSDPESTSVSVWRGVLASLGASSGGVVSGWLFDVTGSFQATFFWMGGALFASILSVFVHFIYKKRRQET